MPDKDPGQNPEQPVLDAIDELVNESLSRPITDSYSSPWHDKDGKLTCGLCGREWHGLTRDSCPGAYATEEQTQAYKDKEVSSGRADSPVPFVTYYGTAGSMSSLYSWYRQFGSSGSGVDATGSDVEV